MLNNKIILAATAILASGSLASCSSLARAAGATKVVPDEFNIVTKAPLSVPPEYNLTPPRAGDPTVSSDYTSEQARQALLGDIDPAIPSAGEQALLAATGAGAADPAIRFIVDGEAGVDHKSVGMANRILFWQDGRYVDEEGQPLSAEEEADRLERIHNATGGGEVEIERRSSSAKLPGL